MTITLGSLFDGIGVFPLAASRHGITPVWASEIIPDAISITKRHFPEMEHLGDITKLDGRKIPPSMSLRLALPVKIYHKLARGTGLQVQNPACFIRQFVLLRK